MIQEQPEEDDEEEETDLLAQMGEANERYDEDLRAIAAQEALKFQRISSNFSSTVSHKSK